MSFIGKSPKELIRDIILSAVAGKLPPLPDPDPDDPDDVADFFMAMEQKSGCRCERCQKGLDAQDRLTALLRRKGPPVQTEEVVAVVTAGETPACECSCDECKGACQRTACLGTPQDIKRLIDHGHAAKLVPTHYMSGLRYGVPPIPMVQIRNLPEGPFAEKGGGVCPLWDKTTGLCTVHPIKPTEGRMGDHSNPSSTYYASPNFAVAMSWLLPTNRALVCELFRAVGIEPKDASVKEHLPGEVRSA